MTKWVLTDEACASLEIPKENKLTYKKSYMHMLNRYAFSEGAISQDLL